MHALVVNAHALLRLATLFLMRALLGPATFCICCFLRFACEVLCAMHVYVLSLKLVTLKPSVLRGMTHIARVRLVSAHFLLSALCPFSLLLIHLASPSPLNPSHFLNIWVAFFFFPPQVGAKRGLGYNDERDQTLNQLLTELDGFEGRQGEKRRGKQPLHKKESAGRGSVIAPRVLRQDSAADLQHSTAEMKSNCINHRRVVWRVGILKVTLAGRFTIL